MPFLLLFKNITATYEAEATLKENGVPCVIVSVPTAYADIHGDSCGGIAVAVEELERAHKFVLADKVVEVSEEELE